MGLGRRAAALAQVAGRAGRRHIFPCRAAAKRARDDVIEGEVVVRSAILAAEAVAKEEVEPGEGGMSGGTDILEKRDERRQPHGDRKSTRLNSSNDCAARMPSSGR